MPRLSLLVTSLVLATALPSAQSSDVTARIEAYGSGSPGTAGVPVLAAESAPVLGTEFSLGVRSGAPGASGAAYWGTQRAAVPIAAFGATVHVLPLNLLAPFTLDARGVADGIGALTPVDASLTGQTFQVQAVVLDPAALGSVAFTRALETRFGPLGFGVGFPGERFDAWNLRPDVALVDVNADGALDLFYDEGSDGLTTRFGLGTGAFSDAFDAFLSSANWDLGDLDGDGFPDLVTRSSLSVVVRPGNGSGSFVPAGTIPDFPTGAGPIRLADLDGDGLLDIVGVSPDGVTPSVQFARGLGGLAFDPAVSANVAGLAVNGSTVADVTGDGRADVVLATQTPDKVEVIPGTAAGFGAPTWLATAGEPRAVAAGDWNGDGIVDLAATVELGPGSFVLQTFLGSGAGSFGSPTSSPLPFRGTAAHAVDWDGDGSTELLVGLSNPNVSVNKGAVALLEDSGSGSLVLVETLVESGRVVDVVAGDLDGDGNPDLAFHDEGAGDVQIHVRRPTGELVTSDLFSTVPTQMSVATADLDDDGVLDLAIGLDESNEIEIRLGLGDGTFEVVGSHPVGTLPVAIEVADFNGDGVLDLAIANRLSDTVSVLPGTGTGDFGPAIHSAVGFRPVALSAADLDGDGVLDLAIAHHGSLATINGTLQYAFGNGDGSFGATTLLLGGVIASDVECGDLDGDGRVDLVVTITLSSSSTEVLGYFGTPGGGFGPAQVLAPNSSRFVTLADMDQDGELDFVTGFFICCGQGELRTYVGDGTGSFLGLNPVSSGVTPGKARVADFNGDGLPDVAFLESELALALGSGAGELTIPRRYHLPGPIQHAVGDFDSDGLPDVVVVGGGEARFFPNLLLR